VKRYAVRTESAVEADVEAAFDWYEGEEPRLGFEFLAELRAAYERIVDHPFGYRDIRSEFAAR
jgi:plasmid stabilization system protein ParE